MSLEEQEVFFLFHQPHFQHHYIFIGAVVRVAWLKGYFVYNVLPFYYLAKHGITTIEVGCAAYGLVSFPLCRGEFAATAFR